MSCDKLVFDLSQEVEGSPNVFIRKDWLNILDNQNQNYQNNQSIIDTSQLANSNKYMAYREAYLAMPMLLSVRSAPSHGGAVTVPVYGQGLKNWFGTMIHSFTLDYNGTTIVQQTPFCNLWNSFKLMTTLSWGDVSTMGPTIGFYPDTPDSFQYYRLDYTAPVLPQYTLGSGITNNACTYFKTTTTDYIHNRMKQPLLIEPDPVNAAGVFFPIGGNEGLSTRIKWIAYDTDALVGTVAGGAVTYGATFLSKQSSSLLWKSHISTNLPSPAVAGTQGILQISIMATIYLKHIHSFFNMCPLLKGVFMKLTFNLNNSRATILNGPANTESPFLTCEDTSSYIGGTQPLMVVDTETNRGGQYLGAVGVGNSYYDLVVGSKCYNALITSPPAGSPASADGGVSKSIYLYVPAYTFNPTFEQAYLSNNIKQIKYTDIYQYQFDVGSTEQFNQLITNGIANIKSVLIVPVSRLPLGIVSTSITPEYLSPFSPCGGGTVSPLTSLTNFNVQISGQNAIYNMQRYTFEEWNNQLYGQNAVNGGLTDGLTSGLIDFSGFQTSYGYYYVNVERMLPVEQSVPKSVQILGQCLSLIPLRMMVFIEYGVQVSIDVLTGARV